MDLHLTTKGESLLEKLSSADHAQLETLGPKLSAVFDNLEIPKHWQRHMRPTPAVVQNRRRQHRRGF